LLGGSQLLDPAAIVQQQRKQQQKEVLQPPAVFEYRDKEADPHLLQATNNLKVGSQDNSSCFAWHAVSCKLLRLSSS
jgi:hypothetical protein